MITSAALCALSFTTFVSDGYAQSKNNEVFIEQIGSNTINVLQGVDGLARNNTVATLQEGSGNIARVKQGENEEQYLPPSSARDNTATLTQSGDKNRGSIRQGTDVSAAEDNTAVLTQTGEDNLAEIVQGASGGNAKNNTATLTQNGDNNGASILQSVSESNARGNAATLTQNGGDNEASIEQGSLGRARDNAATINQNGNNNQAKIYQSSISGLAEDNTAALTQNGDNNKAEIFQSSGFIVVRNEDGNIEGEEVDDADNAFRSTAVVSQQGDDHYAAAIQAGADDLISIQQSGTGNFALVNQGAPARFR